MLRRPRLRPPPFLNNPTSPNLRCSLVRNIYIQAKTYFLLLFFFGRALWSADAASRSFVARHIAPYDAWKAFETSGNQFSCPMRVYRSLFPPAWYVASPHLARPTLTKRKPAHALRLIAIYPDLPSLYEEDSVRVRFTAAPLNKCALFFSISALSSFWVH